MKTGPSLLVALGILIVFGLFGASSHTTRAVDGSLVAFTSERDGFPKIYVGLPDGSGVHRLTQQGANIQEEDLPEWSPSGDKIAFLTIAQCSAASGWCNELTVADSDGSNLHTLVTTDVLLTGGWSNIRWSPDGKKIAVVEGNFQSDTLSVVDSNTGTVMLLPVEVTGSRKAISWSPDSNRIAFDQLDHSGGQKVGVVDVTGGLPIYLPAPSSLAAEPTWSPTDPDKIAFECIVPPLQNEICVYTFSSGETKPLVKLGDFGINFGGPNWSPDGTKLAASPFAPGGAGLSLLVIIDAATGSLSPIGLSGDTDGSTSWAAGSRYLATTLYPVSTPGTGGNREDVWVIDTVTGYEWNVSNDGGSRDGQFRKGYVPSLVAPSPSTTPTPTPTPTTDSAEFTANKVFSDNSAAAVSVSLTCNAGNVTNSPQSASQNSPAVFTVTGIPSGSTSCTAYEVSVPTGYTESDNCANVAVAGGGSPSCTITNTLTPSVSPGSSGRFSFQADSVSSLPGGMWKYSGNVRVGNSAGTFFGLSLGLTSTVTYNPSTSTVTNVTTLGVSLVGADGTLYPIGGGLNIAFDSTTGMLTADGSVELLANSIALQGHIAVDLQARSVRVHGAIYDPSWPDAGTISGDFTMSLGATKDAAAFELTGGLHASVSLPGHILDLDANAKIAVKIRPVTGEYEFTFVEPGIKTTTLISGVELDFNPLPCAVVCGGSLILNTHAGSLHADADLGIKVEAVDFGFTAAVDLKWRTQPDILVTSFVGKVSDPSIGGLANVSITFNDTSATLSVDVAAKTLELEGHSNVSVFGHTLSLGNGSLEIKLAPLEFHFTGTLPVDRNCLDVQTCPFLTIKAQIDSQGNFSGSLDLSTCLGTLCIAPGAAVTMSQDGNLIVTFTLGGLTAQLILPPHGSPQFHIGVSLTQGATASVQSFIVSGQQAAHFNVTWAPQSTAANIESASAPSVSVTLQSPSGQLIDKSSVASGVHYSESDSSATFEIDHPEAGVWQVNVTGSSVGAGGVNASIDTSSDPASSQLLGDTNCDGRIDGTDVTNVLADATGIVPASGCIDNGDVNNDGHITAIDGLLILKYWAGLITSFPANAH